MDQGEFRRIYDQHWTKVYRYCLHYIQDAEVVKDLMQEIFFSLWDRRETIQIHSGEEAYLLRAAKYKIADFYRQKAPISISLEQDHLFSTEAIEAPLYHQQLEEKVADLLRHLSPQSQQIYQLSRQEHLSNKQIAERLLLSEKSIEYHMTKVLRFLKQHLLEYT